MVSDNGIGGFTTMMQRDERAPDCIGTEQNLDVEALGYSQKNALIHCVGSPNPELKLPNLPPVSTPHMISLHSFHLSCGY